MKNFLFQIDSLLKKSILSKRSLERKEKIAKSGYDANNNLYDLLWKYIQEGNENKCFRFSVYPKEFSNPNTKYDTPSGLYAYNIKEAISNYFTSFDDWVLSQKKHQLSIEQNPSLYLNEEKIDINHINYINDFLYSLPFATDPYIFKNVIFFDVKKDTAIVNSNSFRDTGEFKNLVNLFYYFTKLSIENEKATGWFFEDTSYGEKFNKAIKDTQTLDLNEIMEKKINNSEWNHYINNNKDTYIKIIKILKHLEKNKNIIEEFNIDDKIKNDFLNTFNYIIEKIKKFLTIKITDNDSKYEIEENIKKNISNITNRNKNIFEILFDFFDKTEILIKIKLKTQIENINTLFYNDVFNSNKDNSDNLYKILSDFNTLLSYLFILRSKIIDMQENISSISSEDFFIIAITLFKKNKKLFEKTIKNYIESLFKNILNDDSIRSRMKDKINKELAIVWYLCAHFAKSRINSKSVAARFRTLLEQICGIECIIDSGTGLIHPAERAQVWIADDTHIENVEIVKNNFQFDNRLKTENKNNIDFVRLFYNQFVPDKFFRISSLISNDDNNDDFFKISGDSNNIELSISFTGYDDFDNNSYFVTSLVNVRDKAGKTYFGIDTRNLFVEFKFSLKEKDYYQLIKDPNFKIKDLNPENFKIFMKSCFYDFNKESFKKIIEENANDSDSLKYEIKQIIVENLKKRFSFYK